MSSASSGLEVPATSCSSSALISSCSTASTMGITMAVVEVLESHMDSMVVQHMKHSSSLRRAGAIGAEHAAVELGPDDPQGPYDLASFELPMLAAEKSLFQHWSSEQFTFYGQ